MKYLLLAAIRMYWLIPDSRRRNCLFKQSCSRFVYEATLNYGFTAGLQALRQRFATCRPGAVIYINPCSGEAEMILANNSVIPHDEIAERLLPNRHATKA